MLPPPVVASLTVAVTVGAALVGLGETAVALPTGPAPSASPTANSLKDPRPVAWVLVAVLVPVVVALHVEVFVSNFLKTKPPVAAPESTSVPTNVKVAL